MTTYSHLYIQYIFAVKNRTPLIPLNWEDRLYQYFTGIVESFGHKMLNENKLTPVSFHWQDGFGVFSYSHSQIDNVIQYVMNQKEHQRKKTFKEEYLDLLQKMNVEYLEKYLPDFFEENI